MCPDADWTIPGRINIDEGSIIDHQPLWYGDELKSLMGYYQLDARWIMGSSLNSFNWLYKPMVF